MTNIQNFLLSASEYGIIIPGAALCIIPVTKYLKISAKKFLPFLGIALILISFILGTIDDTQENFNPNIFFVPLMAIMLIMYFIFVDVEKIKLLYLSDIYCLYVISWTYKFSCRKQNKSIWSLL